MNTKYPFVYEESINEHVERPQNNSKQCRRTNEIAQTERPRRKIVYKLYIEASNHKQSLKSEQQKNMKTRKRM